MCYVVPTYAPLKRPQDTCPPLPEVSPHPALENMQSETVAGAVILRTQRNLYLSTLKRRAYENESEKAPKSLYMRPICRQMYRHLGPGTQVSFYFYKPSFPFETPEVMGQPTICFLLQRLEFWALRVAFISHLELFLAAGAYLNLTSLDIVCLSSVLFLFGHLPKSLSYLTGVHFSYFT